MRNIAGFLVASSFIVPACLPASCQAGLAQPLASPQATFPAPRMTPAYDVATIKPPGPNEFGLPLRIYIQTAFDIPGNSTGWVIGPDWINTTKYVIRGKPPEYMQQAMQGMSNGLRLVQERLMMQTLLADRFAFKAHFENREMPVYQLVVAKSGSKLKENPDVSQGQVAVASSMIRGKAVSIKPLLGVLESLPEIGGRLVVDETGLPGTYDVLLKWTPMEASAPSGGNGAATSPYAENVSLFTALQEQLGLKLIPARTQGRVLVIDHIERPSEN